MKRLTFFTLGALIGLTLACSATAPRAAVMAAQPTPQPQQAAPTAPSQPTAANVSAQPTAAPVACLVTAEALNVRTCPGAACAVSGWLTAGQRVTVATMTPSGWANLTAGGWIRETFITCEAKP